MAPFLLLGFLRSLSLRAVLLTLLLLCGVLPLQAAEQVLFAAEPSWLQAVSPPTSTTQAAVSGQRYLLVDRQNYVDSKQVQRFSRFVIQITSTEGLEKASQLAFDFDPSYETLTIHKVQVWREGKPLDRLEPNELKVFQREADLSRFLYSGNRTAYLILPDIRVGDVLEYSYTLQGNNPVMNGRYSETLAMDWDIPIARNSLRLLVAPSRALFFQAPQESDVQVKVSASSGQREIMWQQENVPAVELQTDTPAWFSPNRTLSVSEFASWADVAQWAMPLYDDAAAIDPSIQQLADQLATDQDAAGKIMAALHFVQQEIRYLGMEDGIGSHRPRHAADTLYRRYGDCKDKTVLLMALLKAMGLSPTAALVSLDQGAALPNQQPSPYLFNHVIVTLLLNGQRLWLDGTALNQGDSLDTVAVPYTRYALLVAAGVTSLTPMDGDYRPAEINVRHELWVQKDQNRLQIESQYFGDQAEQQRSQWLNSTPEAMSRRFEEYYSRIYGDIQALGPAQVTDDRRQNRLVMRESYLTSGHEQQVSEQGLDIYADLLDSYLKEVDSNRSQPLLLSPPIRLRQEFLVHLPKPMQVAPYQSTQENAVFRFSMQVEPQGKQLLRISYRYENLLESVPVAELARYRENVRRAKEQLSLNFSLPKQSRQ
jgi:transglutaminase-like putative cysteine protease